MNAELTDHRGYEKHGPAGYNSGSSKNRKSRKKLKDDFGEIELATARDRNGAFEKIVPKHETRWTHPTISQVWRRDWECVMPFFAFAAEIRKVVYTTNAVESLNMSLRGPNPGRSKLRLVEKTGGSVVQANGRISENARTGISVSARPLDWCCVHSGCITIACSEAGRRSASGL